MAAKTAANPIPAKLKRGRPEAKLEVVYLPLDQIRPDPKNARHHPAAQVEQLRASMRKFKFTNPILLRPNGMIGAGEGRWLAAHPVPKNEWTGREEDRWKGYAEVPTITLRLTEKQWRAYAIADNKIPMAAEWNVEILRAPARRPDAAHGADPGRLRRRSRPGAVPHVVLKRKGWFLLHAIMADYARARLRITAAPSAMHAATPSTKPRTTPMPM